MKTEKIISHRSGFPRLALILGLLVIFVLPLSGVLEIHHVFAAADHDGHAHSDFDLCQWVQQHASGTFTFEKPLTETLPLDPFQENFSTHQIVLSGLYSSFQLPRPPPFS